MLSPLLMLILGRPSQPAPRTLRVGESECYRYLLGRRINLIEKISTGLLKAMKDLYESSDLRISVFAVARADDRLRCTVRISPWTPAASGWSPDLSQREYTCFQTETGAFEGANLPECLSEKLWAVVPTKASFESRSWSILLRAEASPDAPDPTINFKERDTFASIPGGAAFDSRTSANTSDPDGRVIDQGGVVVFGAEDGLMQFRKVDTDLKDRLGVPWLKSESLRLIKR